MESFKALYEDAKKQENVRQLTAEYRKIDKKGEYVLGRLVGVTAVQSSLGGGEYNQYLFDTDEGLVKFSMGRAADSEIGVVLEKEKVYRIEFLGQEPLTGGRKVNKFDCIEIGFSDERISGEVKPRRNVKS